MKKNRTHETRFLRNKLIAFALACTAALALVSCTQSAAADVGEQAARETAFAHAGVSQDDVLSLEVKKSTEDGVAVYEVQFTTADRSYDYDVEQSSGEIVKSSFQPLAGGQASANDGAEKNQTSSQAGAAASQASPDGAQSSAQAGTAVSQSSGQQPSGGQNTSSGITEDEAKTIALQDAGVSASDAVFVRVERDRDDGRSVYDLEFYAGNTEYDYEISAETGEILSYDSDIEGWAAQSASSASGSAVTLEQARELVLERVPGAAASDVQIEQERDDGRDIYEGEVYYDRTEYEFEIDASTGSFIKWSVDYRD